MMPQVNLMQSLKTKAELIMICLALLGMMCTGVYVYATQSKDISDTKKSIINFERDNAKRGVEVANMLKTIDSQIAPAIAQQFKDVIKNETRISNIERNSREDRELLLTIKNDIKWIREKEERRHNDQ